MIRRSQSVNNPRRNPHTLSVVRVVHLVDRVILLSNLTLLHLLLLPVKAPRWIMISNSQIKILEFPNLVSVSVDSEFKRNVLVPNLVDTPGIAKDLVRRLLRGALRVLQQRLSILLFPAIGLRGPLKVLSVPLQSTSKFSE